STASSTVAGWPSMSASGYRCSAVWCLNHASPRLQAPLVLTIFGPSACSSMSSHTQPQKVHVAFLTMFRVITHIPCRGLLARASGSRAAHAFSLDDAGYTAARQGLSPRHHLHRRLTRLGATAVSFPSSVSYTCRAPREQFSSRPREFPFPLNSTTRWVQIVRSREARHVRLPWSLVQE